MGHVLWCVPTDQLARQTQQRNRQRLVDASDVQLFTRDCLLFISVGIRARIKV